MASVNLNPGIRRLVALLNANGFSTIDSGDGKTHDFACDREYPYVVAKVRPDELTRRANELVTLMAEHSVRIEAMGEGSTPCIQATYDPINKIATVDLMHVDDAMLKGP